MKKKVKEPEGIKMLKEAFRVFDSKGEGSISRLENGVLGRWYWEAAKKNVFFGISFPNVGGWGG